MTTTSANLLSGTPGAPSSLLSHVAGHARTVADLLRELGDVPPHRVRAVPPPGTATEADVVRANEDADRVGIVELVDGTLVEKPVGYDEARLAVLIAHYLLAFVLPRKLGLVAGADAMLRMAGGNVREPDVVYTAWASIRGGRLPEGPVKQIPPDLAVEVLSESNTRAEMRRKRMEYFASNGRLVWEVDGEARTVGVFTEPHAPAAVLTAADTLDGGDVLPGFTLALADLFEQMGDEPPAP